MDYVFVKLSNIYRKISKFLRLSVKLRSLLSRECQRLPVKRKLFIKIRQTLPSRLSINCTSCISQRKVTNWSRRVLRYNLKETQLEKNKVTTTKLI